MNEYKQLIELLKAHGKISEKEESEIIKSFNHSKIRKKEILIDKNSSCDKIFFVNSGLLRAYYINEKGNEITRTIAWENRFLTNIVSFKGFSKNREVIECIENGEILHINKNDFDRLMSFSLNVKSIYNDILEEYNAFHIQRFEYLNTVDSEGKMKYFYENFKPLKNRLNDNILSSFLSISKKTLERLKKK